MNSSQITVNNTLITIRPYEERDIPFHEAYIFDSPKDFLEEIGFDPTKFQKRDDWAKGTRKRIKDTLKDRELPTVLIGEINGEACSYQFLDLRNDDKIPRIHFHLFKKSLRGQGLGGPIFKTGLTLFSQIYGYKRFLIEPKATNAPMNALMRKLGFHYIKDYTLEAGPVTQKMVVSQYEILIP